MKAMYKPVFLALALLAAPAAGPGAWAQAVPPPASPTASASYRLGGGDVIGIQVIDFPELCVPQITIPPDGRITVPMLGSLPVAGRTAAQVAQTLAARWNHYVVDPSVTVTLTQPRRESVHVYGFVAHTQAVDYRADLRLTQALAQAGGAADNGDLAHVLVTHGDGRKQTVDVKDPEAAGGTDQDLALAPDDLVYVPERRVQVSVLGEVVKPGSYDYKDRMTVLDALKSADNINPATADLRGATLLRDGRETPLDLDALLREGRTAGNVTLAAGDRIFIPTLHNRIYVDGAVGHPGYYAFKPGDHLVDAINGSGGTISGASDLMKVSVIHQNKRSNTATAQTIDLGRFYQKADTSANVPLLPDDVIYVPIKGRRAGFGEVLQNLIGVGVLASGVRGL